MKGKSIKKLFTKRGLCKNPLYQVWANMKNRCYRVNSEVYIRYGGRGIIVCKEWRDNPKSFIKWAEKSNYKKGLQIDRENNRGNYNPVNCRFVTRKINSQNRSNSLIWTVNGKSFNSRREAAGHFNVSNGTIFNWCKGYKDKGKSYPPKEDCYSIYKYD